MRAGQPSALCLPPVHSLVHQLTDELTADYETRQDALRTVPFFRDAEFDERFGFMGGVCDALHHKPSVVARFFYRITPAELQCKRPQQTDSPNRELWATVCQRIGRGAELSRRRQSISDK